MKNSKQHYQKKNTTFDALDAVWGHFDNKMNFFVFFDKVVFLHNYRDWVLFCTFTVAWLNYFVFLLHTFADVWQMLWRTKNAK